MRPGWILQQTMIQNTLLGKGRSGFIKSISRFQSVCCSLPAVAGSGLGWASSGVLIPCGPCPAAGLYPTDLPFLWRSRSQCEASCFALSSTFSGPGRPSSTFFDVIFSQHRLYFLVCVLLLLHQFPCWPFDSFFLFQGLLPCGLSVPHILLHLSRILGVFFLMNIFVAIVSWN